MSDKCPKCGSAPKGRTNWSRWWECGTLDCDEVLGESPNCLRRQLAQAKAEIEILKGGHFHKPSYAAGYEAGLQAAAEAAKEPDSD